jgi:hypothetical protein
MRPVIVVVLLAFASSGCYFLNPRGAKKTPRPTLVDGGEIELEADEGTIWRSCSEREIERGVCHYRGGEWKRKHAYVDVSFKYAGKPITRGEARALVDENYDAKWATLERKKSACNLSLIPTAIGVLGYMAVIGLSSDRAKQELGGNYNTAMTIAIGAGLGGSLASIPLGGYSCRTANRMANQLGAWNAKQTERRFYRGDADDERAAQEVGKIVEEFNRKVRRGATK